MSLPATLHYPIFWGILWFFVNIFELFLYHDLSIKLLHSRPDREKQRFLFYCCAVLLMTVVNILSPPWLNFLSDSVVLLLLTLYFYPVQWNSKLAAVVIFACVMSLSDFISFATLTMMDYLDPHNMQNSTYRRIAGIFCYFLIVFIVMKIFLRFSVSLYQEIGGKWFLLFLVIPFSGLAIFLSITYVLLQSEVSGTAGTILSLAGVMVLFSNVVAFYLYDKMIRGMEESREHHFIQLRRNMENTHYEIVQKKNEEYARMVHDIKHHFQYLGSLAADGDVVGIHDYLEDLNVDFESHKRGFFTSDKILNVILCEKSEIAQKKGISFYADLTAGIDFLNPVDACTLMGNLLDNAIEAASRCEKNRFVRLKIHPFNNGFTIVRVENSYRGEIVEKGSRLLSTKAKGHHGYGVKSIEQIAEKTGGSMEYCFQNGVFQITVLLNMILSAEDDDL